MTRKSSTFYRLEKNIGDNCKSILEFHSVISNGNMYIEKYKESDGHKICFSEDHMIILSKEEGNEIYKKMKAKGYVFAGIYEMDICGYKTKIK